jgi:AI2M/AI1M-like, HNH endonuclease
MHGTGNAFSWLHPPSPRVGNKCQGEREVEDPPKAAIAGFRQSWRVAYGTARRPLPRRQASVGRQLPRIDGRANLVDLREDPRGSPYADSRNGAEQLLLTAQLSGAVHLLLDEPLRLRQFFAQKRQRCLNRGAHGTRATAAPATIFLLLHHFLHHLDPPDQRLQFLHLRRRWGPDRRLLFSTETGNESSIGLVRLVGLGPRQSALGIGRDAGWVDDADQAPPTRTGTGPKPPRTLPSLPGKRWNKWVSINETVESIWGKRSEIVQRLLRETCELCGATATLQAHHVRKLADLTRNGQRDVPLWVRRMVARRRKSLMVCQRCHDAIHFGRYDGPAFSNRGHWRAT